MVIKSKECVLSIILLMKLCIMLTSKKYDCLSPMMPIMEQPSSYLNRATVELHVIGWIFVWCKTVYNKYPCFLTAVVTPIFMQQPSSSNLTKLWGNFRLQLIITCIQMLKANWDIEDIG